MMKKRLTPFGLRLALAALLVSTLLLCSIHLAGRTEGAKRQDRSQQNKQTYMRVVEQGTLTGTINFLGEAPPRKLIDESADALCAQMNPKARTEDVIVTDGKLANVLVYVQSGSALDAYQFETPATEAVLEHKRCRYAPHMQGIQTGQTLKIINSDQTVHNIHPTPKVNREWNMSQHPNGEPIFKQFSSPEPAPIPFKCNQHPWEKAYVGVFDHPFFAVSARDGSYRIEGLPAGSYTIVAWHERLETKSVQVNIAPHESRTLDFNFAAQK